ncbi:MULTISPECIES: isoprenyl transferase [Ureibacillus]|jgi:undecaprenyl diphosphate synthase|uniref:Isoprenyl transferase n=1 Tax=Ureibacillus thermosphaericus TaxID=51173 RepID=A0A840PP74_URETH|nr:isoprenyl transferase [Ureibacillus thermosphaericus]MBB5147843.1 undecaprenyl diphosphate synthase [Ureibacillus thermosphaericus]NKZ30355.1 isoprenyl transferase [Ureibacillus thermosphaericus]
MVLKNFFNKTKYEKKIAEESVNLEVIPSHIAIIMDGNGRWAKKRAMPRIAGHHEGMKTVRKIARVADDLGVKVLTLYAFSTENWKRPKSEVEFLMSLPEKFLNDFLPEIMERNIRVQMIGEKEGLPEHTKKALNKALEKTKNNTGLILNFAMNYGSRAEIVNAIKKMMIDVQEGTLNFDSITEETMNQYLMTSHLPEPDLLIRTSGEVRLSNFMLWQLAYTEFWFTDTLWPDFNEETFLEAIQAYQKRNRRYGGLKGEEIN